MIEQAEGLIGLSLLLLLSILSSILFALHSELHDHLLVSRAFNNAESAYFKAANEALKQFSLAVNSSVERRPVVAKSKHSVGATSRSYEVLGVFAPSKDLFRWNATKEWPQVSCPIALNRELSATSSLKTCDSLSGRSHQRLVIAGNLVSESLQLQAPLTLIVRGEVQIESLILDTPRASIIALGSIELREIKRQALRPTILLLDSLHSDITLPASVENRCEENQIASELVTVDARARAKIRNQDAAQFDSCSFGSRDRRLWTKAKILATETSLE